MATAPGLGERLLDGRFRTFGLVGFTMTGPPNLRLIESHSSGSLWEKLPKIVSRYREMTGKHEAYNGTTMSTQKSFRGSDDAFC